MNKTLSIYLDLLRFLLSFTVFLSHARSIPYTGGIYWRIGPFAQPAVIGFFVLSGFVIAYVTDHHEHDLKSYLSSRFSRLYSVLLPCLALTAIVDYIGWKYFYLHYLHAPLK